MERVLESQHCAKFGAFTTKATNISPLCRSSVCFNSSRLVKLLNLSGEWLHVRSSVFTGQFKSTWYCESHGVGRRFHVTDQLCLPNKCRNQFLYYSPVHLLSRSNFRIPGYFCASIMVYNLLLPYSCSGEKTTFCSTTATAVPHSQVFRSGRIIKVQSTPENSNLQGKLKKVRVIGSSSHWKLRTNSRKN